LKGVVDLVNQIDEDELILVDSELEKSSIGPIICEADASRNHVSSHLPWSIFRQGG
jgi:hypothetical protein